MAEIGIPMEQPKTGFAEGLRRAFTVKGAKEQWYQNHKELVMQYADVHNGLTEEQRTQAMAQIEADATKSAQRGVAVRVGATALTAATVAFGGGLIGSEKFRNWVGKGAIGKWKFGESLAGLGQKGANGLEMGKTKGQELGGQALDFLKSIPDKAKDLWAKIRKPKQAPFPPPATG